MKPILVAALEKDAKLPVRNNRYDAGLDLKAYYDTIIHDGETKVIRTGCAILIPIGYMGLIMPKSRSPYLIGGGVIDAGYTGEIRVKVINVAGRTIGIAYGDEIAQLIVVPVETPFTTTVTKETLEKVGNRMSDRGKEGGINR